jgi:hypothetical protein
VLGSASIHILILVSIVVCVRFRRGNDPISSREPDWATLPVMRVGHRDRFSVGKSQDCRSYVCLGQRTTFPKQKLSDESEPWACCDSDTHASLLRPKIVNNPEGHRSINTHPTD